MRPAVLNTISSTRQRSRSRANLSATWRHRTTIALAAAAVIAFGVVGTTAVVEHHRAADTTASQQHARAVASVLAAPDARLVSAPIEPQGQLSMVVSEARGEAVVTMIQVPALPATRTYQLWVMQDGVAPRSIGVTAGGGQLLVTDVTSADQVGVTVEPAGGSTAPTTNPIAVVNA